MSSAFVKEEDAQWLHEIPGTVSALMNYLRRENNGIRIFETKIFVKDNIEIHEMSNGLSYAKDADGKWEVIL